MQNTSRMLPGPDPRRRWSTEGKIPKEDPEPAIPTGTLWRAQDRDRDRVHKAGRTDRAQRM